MARLMTEEEYFLFRAVEIATKYGVEVEIDRENNTVNYLTEDETLINTIAIELEEVFK